MSTTEPTKAELLDVCKALANWVDKLGTPWPKHLPIGSSLACDADLFRARDIIAKAENAS